MSDWQSDLEQLFAAVDAKEWREEERPARPEVTTFFNETVLPAFGELREVLARHGRTAAVSSYVGDAEHAVATIIVSKGSERAIEYTIRVEVYPDRVIPYAVTRAWSRTGKAYTARGTIRPGVQHYGVQDLTKDDIERNFVEHYTPMLWRHLDETQS